ncbi:MAG: GNAT family N-acetyltransferase [Candidatus Methanoplasma sp.]|jgi:GNAT superfamily N-acetyltransferase|nr:GNAT family N-acetyltransferase [Candidatus Methanoplasma sp.]
MSIRVASEGDEGVLLALIMELAEYERLSEHVTADAEDLRRMFFVEKKGNAVICEASGGAIGFATYFFNLSTFAGRPGLYIEDLYVRPEHRGKGVGKSIMSHLAKIALDGGCMRMDWSVLDWNVSSISFYDSIGARKTKDWIPYRISGKAMKDLADGCDD